MTEKSDEKNRACCAVGVTEIRPFYDWALVIRKLHPINTMKSSLLTLAAVSLLACPAYSAVIAFDLLGKGAAGLSSTNENTAVVSTPNAVGTGGETGAGIIYDNVSKLLTINIGWGSLNGFTDLSSAVNNSHIHAPTPASGVGSFTQNAGVLFNLVRVSSTANGGSIATSVTLSPVQEAELLDGRFYVNIHTAQNGTGEIRGNIVIPEPSHALLGLLSLSLLARRRRP